MKKRQIIAGRIISIYFIVLPFVFIIPGSLLAGEPGEIIMDTINRGMNVLKDPSLEGKSEELRQRLWEEISPIFNFEEMSKRALGMHWRKRSPEEKKEFTALFTEVLKDTYIGKTDSYSGEKIIYTGEKQDDNYATVQTKFITKTGKEIVAEFRLLRNQGKWKIYDVVIEGVSLVNNYRSQFYSILSRSSFTDLIKKLKEKT